LPAGPALRQVHVGIAVSSATDVAKAAARMVMTQAGLAGVVFAVREGWIGFQRLLTYTQERGPPTLADPLRVGETHPVREARTLVAIGQSPSTCL
jgi:hypothetical protein